MISTENFTQHQNLVDEQLFKLLKNKEVKEERDFYYNAGLLALWKACETFDGRGNFKAYARNKIRNGIVDCFRQNDFLSRKDRKDIQKYNSYQEKFFKENNRFPNETELFRDKMLETKNLILRAEKIYLSKYIEENGDNTEDSSIDLISDVNNKVLISDILFFIKNKYGEKGTQILEFYFLGFSFEEISKKLGLTRARISQIFIKMCNEIRSKFSLIFYGPANN